MSDRGRLVLCGVVVVACIVTARIAGWGSTAPAHPVAAVAEVPSTAVASVDAGPADQLPALPDDISEEIERKGTPGYAFFAGLKTTRLWKSVVIDFNRTNKSNPDELSMVLSDSWYEFSQGQRRQVAKSLASLWMLANAGRQRDATRSRIYLWTQDKEIAAHSDSSGDVVLKDLHHGRQ